MLFLDKHNNKASISPDLKYFFRNNQQFKITKVYVFNSIRGKLETDEFILKYSKGILSVFDKNTNEFLSSYTFNESFGGIVTQAGAGLGTEEGSYTEYVIKNGVFLRVYLPDSDGNKGELRIIDTIKNTEKVEDIISVQIANSKITYSGETFIFTSRNGRYFFNKSPVFVTGN